MLSYVSVGSDDISRAQGFYDAFLPALGYGLETGPEGLSYALPEVPGQVASVGNGQMVAFEARGQAQVRAMHAAALAAGGTDEGQPGFRASYGPRFYVGYLRDPQGNKIALFSSNPEDPGRDD